MARRLAARVSSNPFRSFYFGGLGLASAECEVASGLLETLDLYAFVRGEGSDFGGLGLASEECECEVGSGLLGNLDLYAFVRGEGFDSGELGRASKEVVVS